MKKIFYITLLIQAFLFLSLAQTNIPPGDVYGIWGISGSPYHIQGDINIPNDSTLIIEHGTQVVFEGHYALNVQGRLLAIGNETSNITFTINDTTGFHNPDTTLGGWNGIQFIDTPSDNDTSKIIYCNLQYGKAVGSSPPDNAGGAIFISTFNKVLISNCLIKYNSAGGSDSPSGGGIGLHFASITLVENEISHNRAWDGGGIKVWDSNPILIGNFIDSNQADEGGGGIWIGGLSNSAFNYDIITNNTAGGNGGGMVCWQTTSTTLNTVNVFNNSANWGGGIGLFNCETQINNCNIIDNGANSLGGGIGSDFSFIEINNTNFERNTASIFGGAIGVYNSEINIQDCNLANNGAGIRGGGIHSDWSNISIINTNFERDTSTIFGGAIAFGNSEVEIKNCSLFDNSARILGGAIHSDFSTINIFNTTFERDTTSGSGGAIFTWQSNLLVDSCRFFQNSAWNEAGAIEFIIDTTNFIEKFSIQIKNSEFLNNTSANLYAGVKIKQDNSDTSLCFVRMDKNLFKGNTAYAYSAIRFIGNIDDIIVDNSIFENNSITAFTSIFSANGGAKVKVNNSVFSNNYPRAASLNINARIDFMNCTFANNYGTNSAALSIRNNAEATITNSILWNNGNNPILIVNVGTNGSILTVNYSDIQFGPDSLTVPDSLSILNWGVGNIDAAPLFADTLNSDFHLQNLSPCIGTGIDSLQIAGFWYHAPLTDIEGNPRPNPAGTMPDLGAYESSYPTNIEYDDLNLPTTYDLYQNYPNPFNPTTKIKYAIPERSIVELKVYDVIGREVELLVNEEQDLGYYELDFNASKFSSGVYFYQLKAGTFIQTKKMILVK